MYFVPSSEEAPFLNQMLKECVWSPESIRKAPRSWDMKYGFIAAALFKRSSLKGGELVPRFNLEEYGLNMARVERFKETYRHYQAAQGR